MANRNIFERDLPLTPGEERYAARSNAPTETGMGASRDLLTQSGMETAFDQATPMTEGYVYTAAFSVSSPKDVDGNPVPFAAVVTVKFSENGNTVQRSFSLCNGRSISLPGRVIDVRVVDTTPLFLPVTLVDDAPVPTPGEGSKYTVRMTIERGVRADTESPVTLYGGCLLLAPSESLVFPIPQEAGVVSVAVAVGAADSPPTTIAGTVVVQFTGPGGIGIFKSWVLFTEFNTEIQFVTVPPGATELVITSEDDANSAAVSVEWGIDG